MDGRNVIVNGKPLPEHQIEAIDNNDKAPLTIVNAPPRKPGELYDVYYNPDFVEEDYPIFAKDHEGDGHELVVPAGKYFVMGDNRNNSEDSRYWGFVPRDLVIGRAMFVYWSYDESAPNDSNPLLKFFTNTRWGRTGTMVK
jgi:signal peptidase I